MNRTESIPTSHILAIALDHHRCGRIAEAEGIYRQIISREPRNARALDHFGVLAVQTGRLELAEGLFRRALAQDADNAGLHCNLGDCLRKMGKYDEAIAVLREAIRLRPELAVAHNNMGAALAESLRLEEAVNAYQQAIALDPQYAAAHTNLANVLKDLGRLDEAISAARNAVALRPEDPEVHNNLGVPLAEAGRLGEAIESYGRAIVLNPAYADAYSNLGNALADAGRHAEALTASRRAVEIDPPNVQSHWNHAVILLRSGDLLSGWREYEWRWITQAHFPRPSPRFFPPRVPSPHWKGGDIAGATVFLHAEQGFGDTIHFCRYAPLVAARGASVVLEVQPELRRLMESLGGVAQVIARGDVVPRFDPHCPLMSLPLAFGTTLQTIPASIPYLQPTPDGVEQWKQRLGSPTAPLRVGLCWAGSATHANDVDRSLALAQFAPLASDIVEFISLQKGPPSSQSADAPTGMRLIDFTGQIGDFADTAALIAALDLVITADTAVAHVAGALGKPVWVLIRWLPDWRWRTAGEKTPWYPTMRLFRQQKRGDWTEVIQRVSAALQKWTDSAPASMDAF